MTENLRVCLVNDSFPPTIDGVANAVVNYARVITQNHGFASVLTPYYPDADDSAYPFPVLRYPSVDTQRLVGYRAGLPFSSELLKKTDESRFSIIHSHCPVASTVLARMLRAQLDLPVVFTYHTKFDVDIAKSVHGRLFQEEAVRLLVQNISACDEIWTVSRGAGENLRSLGYEGSFTVMPNGVDFPVGRVPDETVRAIAAGYDLPADVPVFLFVGRMMWYKGIRITLDALHRLRGEGHDFRMVLVGGGTDKDEIVRYTESLGLTNRVFFVPPLQNRDHIRAWYCRADLFLFPSTFDTNGLVVREAAACGLGSVLVRGSCAAEDITDGRTGLLIDENAESMAALLSALCADRDTMHRVGEHAQQEIYLSWEDAVAHACDRYGAVIENYNTGKYPLHERPSDELFHWLTSALELQNKIKAKRGK